MISFIAGRLFAMLVSAWLIVTVVFVRARITGDPLALLIPDDATVEEERAIRDRYGLDDPIDFATMSCIPRTSNTARIGPPAMMPVPGGAARRNTLAAPWRP